MLSWGLSRVYYGPDHLQQVEQAQSSRKVSGSATEAKSVYSTNSKDRSEANSAYSRHRQDQSEKNTLDQISSWLFILWSRGIDSKEPIPLANVAWARICKRLRSPGIDSVNLCNRPARLEIDSGSLKGLQIRALAGWYNYPIPTRFLVPIDCLKIPARCWNLRISSSESIPGLLKHLQIWALAHQGIGWRNQFLGIDSWAS